MAAPTIPKLIRLKEVEAQTGLGHSSIYLYSSDPDNDFPRPVRIAGSAAVRWVQFEVSQWIERQIEKSRNPGDTSTDEKRRTKRSARRV